MQWLRAKLHDQWPLAICLFLNWPISDHRWGRGGLFSTYIQNSKIKEKSIFSMAHYISICRESSPSPNMKLILCNLSLHPQGDFPANFKKEDLTWKRNSHMMLHQFQVWLIVFLKQFWVLTHCIPGAISSPTYRLPRAILSMAHCIPGATLIMTNCIPEEISSLVYCIPEAISNKAHWFPGTFSFKEINLF